jgi:hypothetical protein
MYRDYSLFIYFISSFQKPYHAREDGNEKGGPFTSIASTPYASKSSLNAAFKYIWSDPNFFFATDPDLEEKTDLKLSPSIIIITAGACIVLVLCAFHHAE